MRIPNYTRQELCNEVYRAVLEGAAPLTRLEIARLIGRKKTPHVVSMIEDLATGGWFKKEEIKGAGRLPVFAYSIGKKANIDRACQSVT